MFPAPRSESSESVKTVTVTQTTLTSPDTVRLQSTSPETSEILSSSSTLVSRQVKTNQRISKQLEEVRQGIFKLLTESEDEADHVSDVKNVLIDKKQVTDHDDLGVAPLVAEEDVPGYTADDDDDDSPDSASQSVEINTVNIVTEEAAATGAGASDNMGCVSVDREERNNEDRGTDSGIDRGLGSSRAASAEGWLARLTSRVGGGGRHASSGSYSQSSTPDPGARRLRRGGSAPESPRDGGFAEAGLEMRVRELWLRLAQMETEKLRAVEVAVEEERKRGVEILSKEKLVMEREKRELKEERERLSREREKLDQQLTMYQQSQSRESDLINKLQVKSILS